MSAITIAGLTQEAKTYQEQLRFLAYYVLAEQLASLGIQLVQAAGTDIRIQAHRKGGLLKPYNSANVNFSPELMKFVESKLEMRTSYISIIDNIKNYKTKKLMNFPMPGTAQNQTKKHPFEELITSGIVKTAAEDILDALFSAEYDVTDQTPQGCFDGIDTLINAKVTSLDISVANKNLVNTGAIIAPASSTDFNAINTLVDFVRSANPFLQKNGLFYIPKMVYRHAMDALENKKSNVIWNLNNVQDYINDKANSTIRLVPNSIMGVGDRIALSTPGNYELGMDTFGDETFVEVRKPYEDPNIAQFWLQADFGSRINSIHPKEFQVNERAAVPQSIAGDY